MDQGTNQSDEYQAAFIILSRDYWNDMAVLRDLIDKRTEKFQADRLDLEKKYRTPLHPDRARVDDKSRA